jgi:hypothetical protein
MTAEIIDLDHERMIAAIAKHTREDGTINYTKLAEDIGGHRTTAMRRVASLAVAGALGTKVVLPGFGITKTAEWHFGDTEGRSVQQKPIGEKTAKIRPGFGISQITTLRNSHGETSVEWTQQRPTPNVIDMAEMLKEAFSNMPVLATPQPCRFGTHGYLLTLYPLADLHFGLYAWGRETVDNWDLRIAEKVIGEVFQKLVTRASGSDECVILGGGDQMHADNNNNETSRSHNTLQVDGRYQKVLFVTCMFFVRLVMIALTKHRIVSVRLLKGNHDDHAAIAIAYFLLAHFRNEPRVKVDADPSAFWKRRFGKTFLAATHGHETKPAEFDRVMASRWREDWGASTISYGHMFHIHHKSMYVHTKGGAIIETHETPIPPDVYAFNNGFWSDRSLQLIEYSEDGGEVGRLREPVREQKHDLRIAA